MAKTEEKKKRTARMHFTFVGIIIDKEGKEGIAGFFSTFKDVEKAFAEGSIVAVQVWHGKDKMSR